jgi:hypothetical protein
MHEPQVGKEALKALRPAKDSDVDDFLAHLEEEPSSSTQPPSRSEEGFLSLILLKVWVFGNSVACVGGGVG